ncbi:hypothetical protein [Vulcanisaeta distributa]|uniref:hypothetical protein n=1 Tax=Vulcanisaeta distributa TaxID=164451 RepID=UPI000B2FF791|nr:hypothetical protein [Vulcanisaeta distributa]
MFYYGEFYVNNTYVGSKLVPCGSIGVVWNLLNETYTGQYMVLSVAGMNIMANISIVPPLINVVNYLWNITGTNEYVIVNLSIYGPYEYAVLSHYVSNSTLQLTYSLPANYTMLTINTGGFGNITVSRPTPLISLESPAVTIYPQPINAIINITMPPTLAYQGLLNTYLNGSLYSSTMVDLSPGESSLLGMVIKPTVPGTYVINVELGALASINVTVMSVELFRLSIEAEPLVIIGHNETINIILNDYPAISVPVNLTLQGCINDTTMVMANTSLSLGFNRECALLINASAYTLTGEAISYWDYLNLWINNTVGYYDGYPLILNGTITAYATFLNGSEVPATVLINGSTTLTPRYLGGLITITLSINYLGVTNESTVSTYVIPPTYFEAEKILSELGNPQFLNATVSNAIMSGNWSLVDEIINEYQASSRPYDPLAQLSRYLLVQAIMSGSASKISLVNAILRYELLIYTVLILIIILVIVALHRVRARSRKS